MRGVAETAVKRGFFITGTDTGVGKTRVTVALMGWLRSQGLTVVGMKPVATGCMSADGVLRNGDALLLQKNASVQVPYEKINPYAFEPPVSPHIAARMAGCAIDLAGIERQYRKLQELVDCVLVEGVGGWEVPLDRRRKVSDLARSLGLPVILVVGLRLGCLNHALLTYAALARGGVQCAGWIANQPCADFACLQENIETLNAELPIPCLGFLPYGQCDEEFHGLAFKVIRGNEILRHLLV
jgi:dethiobiotin synthetase